MGFLLSKLWYLLPDEPIVEPIAESVMEKPLGLTAITETELVDEIASQQDGNLSTKGEYIHIPKNSRNIDSKDVEYEVNVYKTSKGEVGYQIVIYKNDRVKAIGHGFNAQNKTFEKMLPIVTATST